jgi:hypothetical protein
VPGYSFINGALLNTQSGQVAFTTPNGLADTTVNWPHSFPTIKRFLSNVHTA